MKKKVVSTIMLAIALENQVQLLEGDRPRCVVGETLNGVCFEVSYQQVMLEMGVVSTHEGG